MGVPVYATTEDRLTPAALSRYCTRTIRWRTTGHEDPADLVGGLAEIGRWIGRPTVAVPVDDEAAVLLAEQADELSRYFLFPRMADPGMVRKLASKHELSALCQEHGFPVPAWAFAATGEEVAAFAATARFPVVVKNAAPWVRRRAPAVPGTTVVGSAAELIALASSTQETPALLLQEYIPHEVAEDWIVHLYCDAEANCRALFTGVKTGSWPPNTGATASGIAVPNPALADQVERFCKVVGFHGVADLDVRFDRRDQQYKLVDFNPRMGNQFRLFETVGGLDVIRAQYLDLTGEPVPPGDQINGRRIVVEHIHPLSRLGERGSGYRTPSAPSHSTETELAWLAPDDPLPFLAMLPRFATPAMSYLTSRLKQARRRKHT
jgi:predicted ATP-grasp superfamily ATP-dependent carboligase